MSVLNTGSYTSPLIFEEKLTLFFKFSGSTASAADNVKEVAAILKAHKGGVFHYAKNEKEQEIIWSSLGGNRLWEFVGREAEGTKLWTTDVGVPYSGLTSMIEESTRGMKELGLFFWSVNHLDDGNFHGAIMYHKFDPVESAAVAAHVKKMIARALEMNGTSIGEHSIGCFKKELLEEVGPDTLAVEYNIFFSSSFQGRLVSWPLYYPWLWQAI